MKRLINKIRAWRDRRFRERIDRVYFRREDGRIEGDLHLSHRTTPVTIEECLKRFEGGNEMRIKARDLNQTASQSGTSRTE